MTETSKTPRKKKKLTELTDKTVMRRLFPKEVVREVEKEIGHKKNAPKRSQEAK